MSWTLKNGVLKFSGAGSVSEISLSGSEKASVTKVALGDSVTVAQDVFSGFENLAAVDISKNIFVRTLNSLPAAKKSLLAIDGDNYSVTADADGKVTLEIYRRD